MTAQAARPDVPALLPHPRELTVLSGTTELSEDVRLVTRNVAPLFRKTMRTILTGAGIRVVANKKRFIIDVRVESDEDLDLQGVPADCVEGFYDLHLQENTVLIRTPDQAGALWGAQTLANLVRSAGGAKLPCLHIRDWPALASRGIFVEDKWGPDRMAREDWYRLVDRMAEVKMNRLGIGLYGCWCCQYEGKVTEFLSVPVPDYPELQTQKTLAWYSPEKGAWCEDTYLPRMFADDFLGEVVNYARERGVTVVPFVNSLGHNTLFPRLVPEISAKDENGSAAGTGYCLSNPKTREFIEKFYGTVISKYFGGTAPFFHIQMDEVYPTFSDPQDPTRKTDPWCRCPECTRRSPEENLQDYLLWLIGMLTSKGAERVVMWNDQLTRHMKVLDAPFVEKLRKAGLAERLVLHWWWYNNDSINESVHVALGRELGLDGWVAPMTCYFNWQRYSSRLPNIALMLDMAREEGATGAVSYAVHDPAWADHEEILADYAWNLPSAPDVQESLRHWATSKWGDAADRVLEAHTELNAAAAGHPALDAAYYYAYTYYRANGPYPRHYPEEALERQENAGADAAKAQLEDAAAHASRAQAGFCGVLDALPDANDPECLRGLAAEAARIAGLATTFAGLLAARTAVRQDEVAQQTVAAVEKGRAALLEAMAFYEKNRPAWLVPAGLRDLSVLLEFVEQLQQQLADVKAGKGSATDIKWHVEAPVNQKGWPS